MAKSISSLPLVLKRHSWPALATFASVIGASIAYIAVTPRQYVTSARLMLDEKGVSISELGRDLSQLPSNVPGGPSPLATQAELVKSESILNRAIAQITPPEMDSSSQGGLTTGELSSGLSVKIIPATNILELNYQSQDPTLAAKLLNAVSEAMVEESTEEIRLEAASVRKFLAAEVPQARMRLEQAEADENKYRQTSGVIDLVQQTESLVESLATLEDQERTLSAQFQEARSRDSSLRQITDAGTLRSAYTSVRRGQDEELKKLRAKLAELEAKVVETRLRFTDNHPTLISLIEQRDAIRALYNQQLARVSPENQAPTNIASDELSQQLTSKLILEEVERTALEKKLRVVQTERANLQDRLAQLPIKQQPLTVLTRKREEAADTLKLLQRKLEEARIAEAQLISNIRIIDRAKVPSSAQSPKRPVVLMVATAFGIILAIGVVLILEVMDNTLRDASEAEELLNIPLLQVLPKLPANALSLEAPAEFLDDIGLVEPYRMLLKTLEFRSPKKLRLIVISSTLSGEGKSVVVSHLAAVSAMLYRRTLIIDADLRRPVQHRLFNLPAGPGIANVIDGDETLLSAAQPTGIENLSVLTYGELRSRPSQLLESAAIKSLLAEAAAHYDLVIIDTPPISGCADAATLSRHSDGLVLLTRPSFAPKDALLRAVSELTRNGLPVLGVVLNGVTNQTEKYYRYPSDNDQPTSKLAKRRASLGSMDKNSMNGLGSI